MKADQFDLVYREYFDPVYRYALSLSGDAHAAEEITQETFFKAMRALDRFRGESSLKSWLFSIARNAWISELRRKRRRRWSRRRRLRTRERGWRRL